MEPPTLLYLRSVPSCILPGRILFEFIMTPANAVVLLNLPPNPYAYLLQLFGASLIGLLLALMSVLNQFSGLIDCFLYSYSFLLQRVGNYLGPDCPIFPKVSRQSNDPNLCKCYQIPIASLPILVVRHYLF